MKLINFELMLINLNLIFAYFILLLKTLIGAWHILFIIDLSYVIFGWIKFYLNYFKLDMHLF